MKRILFVCLGNICRSPAGHGIMQQLVNDADLSNQIEIDSAGTANWHSGKRADSRMIQAASSRGYDLTSRARQLTPEDLDHYDLILVMDFENRDNALALATTDEQRKKIQPFCNYCTDHVEAEVPDPYYDGEEGFHQVLDLLEDGCQTLLEKIQHSLL